MRHSAPTSHNKTTPKPPHRKSWSRMWQRKSRHRANHYRQSGIRTGYLSSLKSTTGTSGRRKLHSALSILQLIALLSGILAGMFQTWPTGEGKTIQPRCTKLDNIGQNSYVTSLRRQSKQQPSHLKEPLAEFDSPPSNLLLHRATDVATQMDNSRKWQPQLTKPRVSASFSMKRGINY